jgi:hypothetical protein
MLQYYNWQQKKNQICLFLLPLREEMVRLHISRCAENINFRKYIYSAMKVSYKQPDSPSAKKHGEDCTQGVLFTRQPSTERTDWKSFH